MRGQQRRDRRSLVDVDRRPQLLDQLSRLEPEAQLVGDARGDPPHLVGRGRVVRCLPPVHRDRDRLLLDPDARRPRQFLAQRRGGRMDLSQPLLGFRVDLPDAVRGLLHPVRPEQRHPRQANPLGQKRHRPPRDNRHQPEPPGQPLQAGGDPIRQRARRRVGHDRRQHPVKVEDQPGPPRVRRQRLNRLSPIAHRTPSDASSGHPDSRRVSYPDSPILTAPAAKRHPLMPAGDPGDCRWAGVRSAHGRLSCRGSARGAVRPRGPDRRPVLCQRSLRGPVPGRGHEPGDDARRRTDRRRHRRRDPQRHRERGRDRPADRGRA